MTTKQQTFTAMLLSISGAIIIILLGVVAFFAKGVVDQVKSTNENMINLKEAMITNTNALENKTAVDESQTKEIEILKTDVKNHEGRIIKIESKR